ncbi:hypothetical protein [Anaerocolumna sp. MB42-C2]|uniref:hypothetical protein n=1 Tax=Anaerocolumna sp. MB42-C2 TaxID=3070997 RepID=UPI0027E082AE|nr:hypothetical protein [Anaerocolumna sp. MB42-C2]WMJ89461.1 hypothetical protein RBU59_08030 [Anaerocolumna sp. MB42-C2]
MGDINIEYSNKFGINTFKFEIINELGDEVWQELIKDSGIPDIDTEASCKCKNMAMFMERFDEIIDKQMAIKILSRVRHGLKPSQCAWAREKFLKYNDLDVFINDSVKEGFADFEKLYYKGKDFYGQAITKEVLDFIRQNPGMLSGVRDGNKMYFTAFPANMSEYLQASDSRMKRYHACHCPFAKESILADDTVSSTLCYCSLGHIKNFWEAVFDTELDGEVVTSALNGDMLCTYVVFLPDDIMDSYVK